MAKIKINLNELIHDRKISLNELSRITKIRKGTLINMRYNKSKYISISHIEKLIDFFVCDIEDLIKVRIIK